MSDLARVNPLQGEPAGACLQFQDGTGRWWVRGRSETFIAHPDQDVCSCGYGLKAEPLTDCEHLRNLKERIRSRGYDCPFCRGLGHPMMGRDQLLALMDAGETESYTPEHCKWCRGEGRVRSSKHYNALLQHKRSLG